MAHQIALETRLPIGVGHVCELPRHGEPDVGDECVELAKALNRGRDSSLGNAGSRKIAGKTEGLSAEPLKDRHRLVEAGLTARGYGYACALPRQQLRGGAANARRTAGDQHDTSLHSKIHTCRVPPAGKVTRTLGAWHA